MRLSVGNTSSSNIDFKDIIMNEQLSITRETQAVQKLCEACETGLKGQTYLELKKYFEGCIIDQVFKKRNNVVECINGRLLLLEKFWTDFMHSPLSAEEIDDSYYTELVETYNSLTTLIDTFDEEHGNYALLYEWIDERNKVGQLIDKIDTFRTLDAGYTFADLESAISDFETSVSIIENSIVMFK